MRAFCQLESASTHVGDACYEFVRLRCSFWAAQAWCQARAGCIAHAWSPETRQGLRSRLAEGEKWWVSLLEQPSATEPGASARSVRAAATPSPAGCGYILRDSGSIWAREEACSQELYFICQFGLLVQRRDAAMDWPAHSCQKKMCTSTQTATGTAAPGTQPAPQPATPRPSPQSATTKPTPQPTTQEPAPQPTTTKPAPQPTTPKPAPQPATQGPAPQPAMTKPAPQPATTKPAPQPATTKPAPQPATTKPAPQPAMPGLVVQAPSIGTATTLQDPNLDPFSVNPLLQGASSERDVQAMEETMRQFNQAIRNIHHLPALQRACRMLQDLTSAPRRLSEAAQRDASESLLFLSTQLLRAPLLSNSSGPDPSTPSATSLFQSFSNLLLAMDSSTPTSSGASTQLEAVLENTMAALTAIQVLLWNDSCATESSVMLASPVASTMLSSRNASTLPLSSYRLDQPLTLTLAFPSSPALVALLSKHSRVQVQVSGQAALPAAVLLRAGLAEPQVRGRPCWAQRGQLAVESIALSIGTLTHPQQLPESPGAARPGTDPPMGLAPLSAHCTGLPWCAAALTPQRECRPRGRLVTGLAVNPFKRLDGTEIRSVGSVVLAAQEALITVQDLPEDIEIGLWRAERAETAPSSLNVSSEEFVIELNVTATEGALIVRVLPDVPLLLELSLGYQHPPNGTRSLLNITLPRGRGQHTGDDYTWVLPAARLQPGLGPCHITAVARQSPEQARPSHVTYTITTIATQCHFWDQRRKAWRQDGCRVGPQSTVSSTQCLCNHLTTFGSSVFVVPRTVNIQDTGRLLLNVASNPVGVALLASLLVVHGVAGIWAWRRDRADVGKVKVTVLADNQPGAHVRYVVQVFTGYRRGAATTAKVVLRLYGTEGWSEPHCLRDPHKPVFERGGLDVFLVTTQRSLGELHSIRLWHDNSGPSPSWYVRRVVVSEVTARRKWHFLCSTWLAADLGDCQRDRVFPAASRSELLSCRQLFHSALVEKVTQEHLWLSVLTRCPWDPFTRVQRLACCLTLLLCTMLINIMFWRDPAGAGAGGQEPGHVLLSWSELIASVQTALVLLPINLVVVRIFQLVPAQDLPPPPTGVRLPRASAPCGGVSPLTCLTQELKETVGFLCSTRPCLEPEVLPREMESVPELVHSLCCLVRSHLQSASSRGGEPAQPCLATERSHHLSSYLSQALGSLQARLRALDPDGLRDPHSTGHAASQLQSLREQLEQHRARQEPGLARAGRSFPIPDPAEQKAPITSRLPRETVFVCWVAVSAASLAAAFFTVLLSLQLDRQRATSWVVSLLLSLLQSIFLVQPLKPVPSDVSPRGRRISFPGLLYLPSIGWQLGVCRASCGAAWLAAGLVRTQPVLSPQVSGLTLLLSLGLKRMLWQDKGKEQQLQRILALLARHPYLELPGSRDWNDPIYSPPCPRPAPPPRRRTWTAKKLYAQLGEILVQVVFLASLMVVSYVERSPHQLYFNQAVRQSLARNFSHIRRLGDFYRWAHGTLLPNLYGPAPGLIGDGHAFLLGSARLRQLRPQAQGEPCSCRPRHAGGHRSWGPPGPGSGAQDSIWVNQRVGEYPVWGQLGLYPGEGYLAHLGPNASSAYSMLGYLERSRWLDGCSCAVFVEFTVYNANVNLFCVVTLLLETQGLGAFLPSAELQSVRAPGSSSSSFVLTPLACAQATYLLLLLFCVLVQVPLHRLSKGIPGALSDHVTCVQGRRLKQQRWKYYRRQRNLLDVSIILLSLAAFGVYVKRHLLQKSVMEKYQQERSRFVSFYEAAKVDSALTYLLAFLLALTTVKLWNLLRLNPRMHLISQTLRRAWQEVVGFLLVLLVLLVGYSIACNLLFGWSIGNYKTVLSSAVTIVELLIGIFNYDTVLDLDPILGSLLITTSIISMLYVVINLFVSALLMTFSKERKAALANKDESMTELMLLKLSSLLGIKQQALQLTRLAGIAEKEVSL
ncbi:polycystin-1-like protein 3 [Emydura macquarii macquarii]|uniref:polycystin-1-like protein 3 n=1 Tax=Emydura macquarii macquarii TaxID=1129001 RepID=UPI00352AE3AD